MKNIFIICITSIAIVGVSYAQIPTPTVKNTNKVGVSSNVKPKAKKKTAKTDTLKPKEVRLPKLVDLGAGKCMACKMLAPILDSLRINFTGKMEVVFIDVWKNSDEADKYKINLIPTQIFYADSGKELFRHEGFYSREDILNKWKELGYDFTKENK